MADNRTIIIAQVFISGMMAFLMTGFFSLLAVGLNANGLSAWANAFMIAWPVAFVLSLGVGKLGFALAGMITQRLARR